MVGNDDLMIRSRCRAARQLVTLEDAGNYIIKLPKAGAQGRGVAGRHGSLDPGRDVGRTNDVRAHRVMRALNRNVEPVFNPDRKDHHWGRRKLKRDE